MQVDLLVLPSSESVGGASDKPQACTGLCLTEPSKRLSWARWTSAKNASASSPPEKRNPTECEWLHVVTFPRRFSPAGRKLNQTSHRS
jgi:hypothetical protein